MEYKFFLITSKAMTKGSKASNKADLNFKETVFIHIHKLLNIYKNENVT